MGAVPTLSENNGEKQEDCRYKRESSLIRAFQSLRKGGSRSCTIRSLLVAKKGGMNRQVYIGRGGRRPEPFSHTCTLGEKEGGKRKLRLEE